MIGRSTVNRLTKTIFYPTSKKKLSEQWRKPIQQLRKENQQNTPIPPDADHKKKIAMEYMQRQFIRPRLEKQRQAPRQQSKQAKKSFNKKKGQQTQPTDAQQQSNPEKKVSEINWLQLQQFPETKELSELVKQASNMLRLKYLPELKEVISKIRTNFHSQGFEVVLNSLFRQNFIQFYDDFKQLDIDVMKLQPKIITSIVSHLAQHQELQRLEILLTELKNSPNYHLDPKHEEFFELLFFKETSQNISFEAGENSVNISSDNKNLVKKIQIATLYLQILQQHSKKKRGHKRSVIIPIWLDKVSKVVLRYKFGHTQFRTLLIQILTHHQYFLPETFYETQQFFVLLKKFLFGHQQKLPNLLEIFERNLTKSIKYATFYRNFTDQLMKYRIQNDQPAFEVDQHLIQFYKKGFELHNKFLSITCTIIASDARYKDLSQHYVKSYMQGFPNQTLSSQDTKFAEEGILNNYNRIHDAEKHEKNIAKTIKTGSNLFTKLKAAIKLGDLTQAFRLFEDEVLKKAVIERQRKNIQFVFRNQLGSNATNFMKVKEVTQFVNGLTDEYLWSLYKRSEDLSVMLKTYIPEDKFSFWEEKEKKQRFEQISRKLATGELDKMKQPSADILASGFDLDEYLTNQFPQLKELELLQYEKEKELIKYILRIEGLIFFHKIHSDNLVVEKLEEFQSQLSEENLQVLQTFGLRDYNIIEYGWQHFEKRFLQMKAQRNVIRDERVDWSGFSRFIQRNRALYKKNIIEQMLIKTPELFKEAQALVKLNEEPIVNRLILWGVYCNEPMAVYLGEKLAMQTGQLIPHDLALKVSRMLSYKRPLSEEFIQRCKDCLKIVGKIDREFIYSFDKEYEHILLRKHFMRQVENRIESKKYDNRDLEDLITFTPRQQLFQKQTKLYEENIVHRAHLL